MRGSTDRLFHDVDMQDMTPSPPSAITVLENPYAATSSAESIPELSPATLLDGEDEPPTPRALLESARGPGDSELDLRDVTMLDGNHAGNDDDDDEDDGEDDDAASLVTDSDDDDDDDDDRDCERDAEDREEIPEHAISFQVTRASVTRAGLLPCCVFVGRVTFGAVDWEVYFGQKQLVRLHLSLLAHVLYRRRRLLRGDGLTLPWTVWREKRAESRVADVHVVQAYIRALLADRDTRNADALLSFLEVSPSRAMSRYGPSLKEGYVHMRMNGAFQLPLYSCVNRTIEALYRHLYRTWMRIAFISAVVTFILPIALLVVTTLPRFLTGQKTLVSADGEDVERTVDAEQVFVGLVTVAALLYVAVFVYKFFDHRLGVIRRWVVLKPNCFAAYRRRSDKEPSEVFLFDKTFTARKGSYRQGVSWMPSGFVVGSRAGFIELDTGHYYTRLTVSVSLGMVCWAIMAISSNIYDFDTVVFSGGVPVTKLPEFRNWTLGGAEITRATNTSSIPVRDLYCGYYFRSPANATLHISSDVPDVVITTLHDSANGSSISTFTFFLGGDETGFSVGLLSNNIGPSNLVAVAKKVNAVEDRFLPSGYEVYINNNIGGLTLQGLNGSSLLQFSPSPHFCAIPIKVAEFNFEAVGYYVLMLLIGGIVASSFGLALNYLISYIGLWHAHVRRDHWYRCVKRLQKVKRQETEYRYRSFAPQRVSTLPGYVNECAATTGTSLHSLNPPLSVRTKATSEGSIDSSSSFLAPPPPPSAIAWHVDGEDTYEAMYKAIHDAKFEILIAGWWVTPDLYLLRPGRKLPPRTDASEKADKTNETQLRNLLLLKAEQGVKIYVLIYREVKLALTLNSAYTKRSLMLHHNIRVLRDPIFQIQSLGFWSHHEKIVCVDQSLAFVGGLDLCFGRYDHSGHPLSDPGGEQIEHQTWPGKDYSNPIIKDFVQVNKPYEDLIDRTEQPRMPWHDVHCSVSGPPVQDIAYHFIQRWNFVCSKNDYQLRTGWCICLRSRRFKHLPKCLLPMDFNGWTLRYPSSGMPLPQDSLTTVPLVRDESMEIDEPFTCQVMRLPQQPYSPATANWGSASASGGANAASPGSGGSTSELSTDKPPGATKAIMRGARCASTVQVLHPNSNACSVQVCRSVSMWSAGVPTETSIHEAYLDTITKAQHYIYIENQFFISGLHSNGVVSNRILQALVDRIERAVQQKEVFRVYVVMPLLPAFEGNIRSEELTNLHAVMHWQFATISRGRYSLFEALRKFTDRPDDYVAFFGLRKYGILPNGRVSTEQIYIHSKLLIADDKYAIIGSANINDRSMTGDRDSEIALVIEDVHFEDGLMDERPYRRGIVAGALRMQLFREHLGLAENDATTFDPTAEWSWLRIRNISARNTQIFESVFDCAPSNRMTSFSSFNNIEVTQIFENHRMNVLKGGPGRHVWDKNNLKDGDYAPWTDVNGVPINMDKVNLNDFVVDRFKDKKRKHFFSMDHDGWCYARNFSVFQEVRMHNFRKRDKIQHFMTDRLMAQVRRRRWVRKDSGLLPTAAMLASRNSSFCESDEEGGDHGRLYSLLRRLRRSESVNALSRANSFSNTRAGGLSLTSSLALAGDSSYPNSPAIATFRPAPPLSPTGDGRELHDTRDSNVLTTGGGHGGGGFRASTVDFAHGTGGAHPHSTTARDSESVRHSSDSSKGGIGASLKKWASFMDTPLDFGRRSRFTEEYFSKDRDDDVYATASQHNDEPLLESGRASVRSMRSLDAGLAAAAAGKTSVDLGDGECQIGHLQTAATVRKEDESRARGQLSEIRGHLVEFPLHFLAEEILKPSIMPRDIHI